MSESLEEMPDGWKFELHRMMKEYGELLQEYKDTSDHYYRQSPYSNWIDEQELIDILDKLKDLRTRMKKLSKDHELDESGQYQGNFLQIKTDLDYHKLIPNHGVFHGAYV